MAQNNDHRSNNNQRSQQQAPNISDAQAKKNPAQKEVSARNSKSSNRSTALNESS